MPRRAAELARSIPWFITEDGLEQIVAIAERKVDTTDEELLAEIAAVQSRRGARYGEGRTRVRDGVATIPVHGPIFRYANFFTAWSGATSTESIATEFGAALEDPSIRAIVLDVDSPGGEVNGLHELAELIHSSRGRKPITAFGSGMVASAAYYIASAADRLVVSPSAIVGSIGTVLQVSTRKPRDGVEELEFVSAQSPRKRQDPFAEDDQERSEARASIQQLVDSLADVFVADVARFRGVSVETVLSDFGEGGVFVGQAALDAGMVDGIGTLESEILSLSNPSAPGRIGSPAAGGTGLPGSEISMDQDKPAAEAEAPATEQPKGDQVAAAVTAERERLLGIAALNGSPELTAQLQADPTMTVGRAAIQVLAEVRAQKAQGKQDEAPVADLKAAHIASRSTTEAGNPAPGPSADAPTDRDENRALGKQTAALVNRLTSRPQPALN